MQSSDELSESADIDIAIIGMSCRFPGAGDTLSFWNNLKNGIESINFFTNEELIARGVAAESLNDPRYIKASAHLEDVDQFDASFFGYTPREAAKTDPQHRLFLEVAWQALEDAGYDLSVYKNPVGIYAGCGENTYLLVNLLSSDRALAKQGISELQGLMNGNNKDSMTTTAAYKLNLRGPGITVQTACSTSLTAAHMACRGLLNYEADMALAGGVWINLLHKDGYFYEPGSILSPDGHCRAFDASAAGTVVGSGVGVVVLKRLSDALADRDTIHAVIKGSAINNDGSAKAGYTAPSVEGQKEVILAAQAIAGISADSISYIEAHGTGTTLGDPIEVAALTQAFRESTDKRRFCGIGSVKTNVGHLDAAAGVAGLIKTVLALKHQILPPSLNFEQPNPQIDFSSSPFYVNTTSKTWSQGAAPRRAGISSFGIGGTNVHMIVEEAPPTKSLEPSRDWQLLMVSARSHDALEKAVSRLQSHIVDHPEQSLADVSYTLQVGRKDFSHRAIALCRDRDEAVTLLKTRENGNFQSQQTSFEDRSVTFLFPGQGAQYIDMARDLYQCEPVFRQAFDRCLQILKPHLDFDLFKILYPGADETERIAASSRLEQTEVTQPALFVIEFALARLWMSWGVQPASMIGHSVGEYVAACLAGVFSLEDALFLVAKRGALLQKMDAGAMLAVMLPEVALADYLNADCDIAAVNGHALCVVSGPLETIAKVEHKLINKGVEYRRLHVSHAFHSSMTEAILPAFSECINGIKLHQPNIPFVSNLSGDWITAQEAQNPDYWTRHLRATVRFNDSLHQLLSNQSQVLLEVGPGETLITLARRHLLAKPGHLMLSTLPHPSKAHIALKHLHLSLGKLWLNGKVMDWNGFYQHEQRYRVSLPTYPFERQSYWIKPDEVHTSVANSAEAKSDKSLNQIENLPVRSISDWFYKPTWRRVDAAGINNLCPKHAATYLIFKDEYALSTAMIECLLMIGVNPIVISAGTTFQRKNEHLYCMRPGELDDFNQLFQSIRNDGKKISHIFHLWSLSAEDEVHSQTERQARNFYSLIYLAKALENNKNLVPSDQKIVLTVVTNQLEDVTGCESLRPEKALLYGPLKVIPQEYPYLDCRMIDIELLMPDSVIRSKLAKQVLAESQNDVDTSVMAYRGPYRWMQVFERYHHVSPIENRLKQGGVYFITGGLGGIGLTLAEYLARMLKAKLVLLGRSAMPARESWPEVMSENNKNSPHYSRIEKIKQLEALGATILLLKADVSNLEELQAGVTQAWHQFGTIDGVIHAAGESSDQLMTAKTDKAMARVLAPKVSGMQALQTVFKNIPLDFMLLCSSLAAIAGGLSKTDYCAANAYLDASAHAAYRDSAFPVFSVNWDGWREVGMAADMSLQDGVGISPNDGVEVFQRIVNGPNVPQIAVSTIDLPTRISQSKNDLVAQSTMYAAEDKIERFPRPALQTAYKSPENELEKSIAEIWQSLLGIESVGVDDNLFELGGDSLLGIQLLSRIRTGYSVDLHPADFFREPTIAALAAIVEEKLLDDIECT